MKTKINKWIIAPLTDDEEDYYFGRFAIYNAETGDILEDCNGFGFKTIESASIIGNKKYKKEKRVFEI